MAAILEMPQYVAYQINVVYAFIKLSAKSHSFNILCTMNGLSCPANLKNTFQMSTNKPSIGLVVLGVVKIYFSSYVHYNLLL